MLGLFRHSSRINNVDVSLSDQANRDHAGAGLDPSGPFDVAAFYHFGQLPDYASLQAPLTALCESRGVMGICLLANEGINGTLAGLPQDMQVVLSEIRALTGFPDLEHKLSYAETMPFLRLKIRLKKEIVTLGVPSVDPTRLVGTYVEPEDWNTLIADPDIVLIDTRNADEVRIGTFEGAIDPQTKSFSQFPDYVKTQLDPKKHPKIAMFCTGGIRCEKASNYMLQQGFSEVYHLKGGILKYLELIPEEQSKWHGDCFVFDRRVAVGHGLKVASHLHLCAGCRAPLSLEERQSNAYEEGVCCPYCVTVLSPQQKASARERHKQMILAEQRGTNHLGPRHASHRHEDGRDESILDGSS